MCVYTHIYVSIHTYACLYTWMSYQCIKKYIYIYVCTSIYKYMYLCVCMIYHYIKIQGYCTSRTITVSMIIVICIHINTSRHLSAARRLINISKYISILHSLRWVSARRALLVKHSYFSWIMIRWANRQTRKQTRTHAHTHARRHLSKTAQQQKSQNKKNKRAKEWQSGNLLLNNPVGWDFSDFDAVDNMLHAYFHWDWYFVVYYLYTAQYVFWKIYMHTYVYIT